MATTLSEATTLSADTTLSEDIILELFDFLGPAPLLQYAQCSKHLRRSLTHDTVLQSVLLRGGSPTARKSLESLMTLLRKGRIYTPSPVRLLRLACGKVCERGCGKRPPGVRPDFGVFFCFDCVCSHGTVEVRNRDPAWRAIREHPRAAVNTYAQRSFLWERDYTRDGERVGPLVTMETCDRLRAGALNVVDCLGVHLNGATAAPAHLLARFAVFREELKMLF